MRYFVKAYNKELWQQAEMRADAMPIYPGSHRGRAANQVGALGEVLFEFLLESFRIPFVRRYATTEDLQIGEDTIDVKTKDRTVAPEGGYDCTVPLYNHDHQRPTRFVFVSLLRGREDRTMRIDRFTKAYLVGWCTFDEMDRGKVWRAGEIDRSNGTKFWTACKNLYIRDLRPMDELLADYQVRSN